MQSHGASYLHSSSLEKVLEHRFVSELTTCLWLGGCRDFEVLRSEVDTGGYDIAVDARGVLRHIQLKSMVNGGTKQHVGVNMRLAAKPSGCVVWYDYDPATLALGPFRWFGTLAGLGLPDPGSKVVRHSKADATGAKNLRSGHRELRKRRFTQVATMAELVSFLFGSRPVSEIELLREHLQSQPEPEGPAWLAEVRRGRFGAIPQDLTWNKSVEFAHLVDGYGLALRLGLGEALEFEERQLSHARQSGKWLGGPAVLWTTLFLEHRRWRTAPFDPDPDMQILLEKLCRQLVQALLVTD